MVGTEPEETQELIEKGTIPTSTYVAYYKAGSTYFWLGGLVILLILSQISCNASDMWVTHWYVPRLALNKVAEKLNS